MFFTSAHEVRYSDVDRFGHVNHLRLLEFLENSRTPFLAELAQADGTPDVLERNGFRVVRLAVDFRAPVGMRARRVEVRTGVARLGNSSVTLSYELWHQDRCCVEAECVLVFIDDQQRTEPMSTPRRDFFARYLAVAPGT